MDIDPVKVSLVNGAIDAFSGSWGRAVSHACTVRFTATPMSWEPRVHVLAVPEP